MKKKKKENCKMGFFICVYAIQREREREREREKERELLKLNNEYDDIDITSSRNDIIFWGIYTYITCY
jgi:hypothetical protein